MHEKKINTYIFFVAKYIRERSISIDLSLSGRVILNEFLIRLKIVDSTHVA